MRSTVATLVFSWLVLMPSVAPAQTGFVPKTLGAEQVRDDIALLKRAVTTIHPGLGRYAPAAEFETQLQVTYEQASTGTNELTFYALISRAIASIRCDHTMAEPPKPLVEYLKNNPVCLPFQFALVDNRMIVTASNSGGKAPEQGTEILSINGVPVSEIVMKLSELISVDGFTDSVKSAKIEYDFHAYYPALYDLVSEYSLSIRNTDADAPQTVTLPGITLTQWKSLLESPAEFADAVSWKQLDPDTALLSVGTFINYRKPVNAMKVFESIFKEVKNSGAKHLIIDLRQNGGGSDDAGIALARFLMPEPFRLVKSIRVKTIEFGDLKDSLTSWESNVFNQKNDRYRVLSDGMLEQKLLPGTIKPAQDAFRGQVSILIGPANASGVTMLLAKLKDGANVRLVGQPTGGSAEGPTAGILVFLQLPNSGLTVRIPLQREYMDIKAFDPGKGVTPDVAVTPTVEDIRQGKDAVLDAARTGI